MNKWKWTFAAVLAGALVFGCSNKQSSSVDTAPLEKNFKSADAATQSTADKAVAAIKAGDYSGALNELKTLASNAKLTPEQQQAVKDVMAQVQKAITDFAGKAKDQANQAAEDLKKSLPK